MLCHTKVLRVGDGDKLPKKSPAEGTGANAKKLAGVDGPTVGGERRRHPLYNA